MGISSLVRRMAGAALVVTALNGCAAQAHTYPPPAEPALVDVELFDRNQRTVLPVYPKDGRRYVVGTPGHEYALRIRNRTAERVLVVASVDGVNVISGDTAAPSQSGYVLDPWGSVEILGWRKSLSRTAAFFFTDLQSSYAARTGRPHNVGVIGVAVFREKPKPVALRPEPRVAAGAAPAEAESARDAAAPPARAQAKLGTGHGRSEESHVRMVRFERASDTPAETVAIQYDRRETLAAMGVLPAPHHYSGRAPDPFPGIRFAPDPR